MLCASKRNEASCEAGAALICVLQERTCSLQGVQYGQQRKLWQSIKTVEGIQYPGRYNFAERFLVLRSMKCFRVRAARRKLGAAA